MNGHFIIWKEAALRGTWTLRTRNLHFVVARLLVWQLLLLLLRRIELASNDARRSQLGRFVELIIIWGKCWNGAEWALPLNRSSARNLMLLEYGNFVIRQCRIGTSWTAEIRAAGRQIQLRSAKMRILKLARLKHLIILRIILKLAKRRVAARSRQIRNSVLRVIRRGRELPVLVVRSICGHQLRTVILLLSLLRLVRRNSVVLRRFNRKMLPIRFVNAASDAFAAFETAFAGFLVKRPNLIESGWILKSAVLLILKVFVFRIFEVFFLLWTKNFSKRFWKSHFFWCSFSSVDHF